MATKLTLARLALPMAVVLALGVANCQPAAAWGNGGYSSDQTHPDYGVHDWIAETALNLQTRKVGFLIDKYHAAYLLGTEAPDNPEFMGDTTQHHVYFRSSGQVQDDSCAKRAAQTYAVALGYLRNESYEEAAYDIGVLTHYVCDVGVFGHTMGNDTDWGPEIHHQDYENGVDTRLHLMNSTFNIEPADIDAFNATLNLSRAVTFGEGMIMPNTWMDAHYDWENSTFYNSALASLDAAVAAVASVINHLFLEAWGPPTPGHNMDPAVIMTAAVAAMVGIIIIVRRRLRM